MNAPSSISLLSLLAGRRKYLPAWEEWLVEAEYPAPMDVVIVDNSGDPEFAKMARGISRVLWDRPEVASFSFRSVGERYSPREGEGYFQLDRHAHVANLYQEILPTIKSDLLFTLEDDVIPPKDALVRMLNEVWLPGDGVGAVAGAYSMPTSKRHITAAAEGDKWSMGLITWDDLPRTPIKVGFTGEVARYGMLRRCERLFPSGRTSIRRKGCVAGITTFRDP